VAREHALGTLGFSNHLTQVYGAKMGILLVDANRIEEAEALLEASYKAVEELDLPPREMGSKASRLAVDGALSLFGMGLVRLRQDRPRLAIGYAKRALAMLTGGDADAYGVDAGAPWGRPITALEKNIMYLIISIESHNPELARKMLSSVFHEMRPNVLPTEVVNYLTYVADDFRSGVTSGHRTVFASDEVVDPVVTLVEVLGMLIDVHLQLMPVKTHYFVSTKVEAVKRTALPEHWDASVLSFVDEVMKTDPLELIDVVVGRADDYKEREAPRAEGAFDKDEMFVAVVGVLGKLAEGCFDCFK